MQIGAENCPYLPFRNLVLNSLVSCLANASSNSLSGPFGKLGLAVSNSLNLKDRGKKRPGTLLSADCHPDDGDASDMMGLHRKQTLLELLLVFQAGRPGSWPRAR